MSTWAMRKRYEWISAKLAAGETFTRGDLVTAFTITTQTASATIKEFKALHPGELRYDGSIKAFTRGDWTKPTIESWQARAQAAEARNAELFDALWELVAALTQPDSPSVTHRRAVALAVARSLALSVLDNRGEDGSSYAARPQTASPSELHGEEYLEFKEALADVRALRQEHRDLNGGGPGWAARNEAAWDRVNELFANEDEAAWLLQQEDAHG